MRIDNEQPAVFWVGNVPVNGRVILAPMDGVTDMPMRALLREMGSALSYTGFVNAINVVNHDAYIEPIIAYEENERPVVFQVFDDDPQRLLEAALILRERNPDIIDVNMGCSAKTVAGRGAGAGLLVEPKKIARIFDLLTRNLDIPVTGKIRLGWDEESRNYLEVAQIIQEHGGKLVAVHGRTKKQGYTGQADWGPIREIKSVLSIPVIGNGDVTCLKEVQALREQTGCDGVMIGRAALENPWLFSGYDREQVPPQEVLRLTTRHLERSLAFYGDARGLIVFRKFAARYLRPHFQDVQLKDQLLTTEDKAEFLDLANKIVYNRANIESFPR